MLKVALECLPDEALAKAMGCVRKAIVHQSDRGKVFRFLRKNPGSIGIVDEDPDAVMPSYFSEFKRETDDEYGIVSYCIPAQNTRLIVIKPRLEEWIIRAAARSNIELETFISGCATGHDLHKIINTRLPQFTRMLEEMFAQKNDALLHLQRLVNR